MFPYSMNFVAGLLQQVCQLCEEQPGREAEAIVYRSLKLFSWTGTKGGGGGFAS